MFEKKESDLRLKINDFSQKVIALEVELRREKRTSSSESISPEVKSFGTKENNAHKPNGVQTNCVYVQKKNKTKNGNVKDNESSRDSKLIKTSTSKFKRDKRRKKEDDPVKKSSNSKKKSSNVPAFTSDFRNKRYGLGYQPSKKNKKFSDLCHVWLIDSGYTSHMTGRRDFLSNYVAKEGGRVKFRGKDQGTIRGYGWLTNGKFTIKNVKYVEGLNYNLLSSYQLSRSGYLVTTFLLGCYVNDEDGCVLIRGRE
ncbi:hypothetical protein OSB04_011249 [Centaurea solstitialis]|uniref:Retrovirus-related Pol polyprotein from transposon TNT 1-94-like beta-barrel domain-containing protein n=1 Tax=Centaurea solstitialis TaxID=347529 RepID=A0AA38T928_9ASTR|nr:hypothetical protein OSB04_011249 [Centaurea solstitialis]